MSRNIFPLALSRNMLERRSTWWNDSLGGFCLIAAVMLICWIIGLAEALACRRTNLLTQGGLTGKNQLCSGRVSSSLAHSSSSIQA
jgi:hypothetical protein